ncbi:MAG: hypothetical protein JF603_04060 [Acidobacteria bacterium]|nr:hypothetical protein [Acidobacteriota bacterium]
MAPAPAQPATPTCPAVPARRQPDPERPRYRLAVTVDLARGVVDGQLAVRFVPDLPTDRLVFRLWPNGPRSAAGGSRLATGRVTVDGVVQASQRPNPTTLVVPLGRTQAAGSAVEASMAWQLTLPSRPTNDRLARTGDAVRMGSFFPILPWEPGAGWRLEPPTSGFAEASTAPAADFVYSISVPPGIDVLASGVGQGGTWRAYGARDIAISLGHFRTATAKAGPVRVVVGVDRQVGDDPQAYLALAVRSITDFAARFGPYPWPQYTLSITPGLRGGIEYPGHVMQGPSTANRTTPHEIGHQWFYGMVGDDQGRDPWLDEGLATWAEARFLGNLQASFAHRSIPVAAAGRLGRPMTFWEPRLGIYYAGVYAQGAKALAALGLADEVDCALRHYVAANAFRIARPSDLAASLRVVFPGADGTLRRFGGLP